MKLNTSGNAGGKILFPILLGLMGLLLRIPTLSSPLTGDEAISFNRYAFLPWEDLLLNYDDTNQHTLFSLLSNFFMGWFLENEIFFRLPSFLAGVLAIPMLYCLSLHLLNSKAASLTASSLLAISGLHLSYSQQGRGYALTVFLALALVFVSNRLLRGKNGIGWGFLLVITGFCMTLTVPSNILFLAAPAVYCFFGKWQKENNNQINFGNNLFSIAISFLLLFLLTVAYFYVVRDGMRLGIRLYSFMTLDPARFLEIGQFLISPWSPWLWIFFAYGWFQLKGKEVRLLFLSIFLVPLILTVFSGLLGFARIYIYWLPFVLMLVSLGLANAISRIMRSSKNIGYSFAGVLVFTIALQPADFLANHYSSRAHAANATMEESREVLSYINENVSRRDLVIITAGGPETSLLNYYLRQRLQENMFAFVSGKKPDKVILINHRHDTNYNLMAYYPGKNPFINPESFKLVKTIHNLRINEFDGQTLRFIPFRYDPDYETQFSVQNSTQIVTEGIVNPKTVGTQALKVKKAGEQDLVIVSSRIKTVRIKRNGVYLLFVYARKYGQVSKAMLAEYDQAKWPPPMGYLNPYLGKLKIPGSDFSWQMMFLLLPVKKGEHNLQEIIHVAEETSYFDGFQSFILAP